MSLPSYSYQYKTIKRQDNKERRGKPYANAFSEPREAAFDGVRAVYPNKTLAVCFNTWSLLGTLEAEGLP